MAEPDKPYGYSIFCDDIRQEVGGKSSYMGVYFGSVYVPSFPQQIPKLMVSVWFYEPIELIRKRTWTVPVQLFVPGNESPVGAIELPVATEEALQIALKTSLPDDSDVPTYAIAQLTFAIMPLSLSGPGRIKVRAAYGGQTIRLGSLKVELPPVEASPASTAS